MKRKLRIWLTLSVAIYFSWGSGADTQSPPQDLPPWGLASALDAQALSVQLTELTPEFEDLLLGNGEIQDLTFLRMITTQANIIYWSTARGVPLGSATQAPSFSTSAASSNEEYHTICYKHQIGSGCLLPPDEIFHATTTKSFTQRIPRNRLANSHQLELLALALRGFSGTATIPALLNLNTLWVSTPGMVVQNFQVHQSGNDFVLTFIIRDPALAAKELTRRYVYAKRNANGWGSVVVR